MIRKPIQLAFDSGGCMVLLCDDGSVWFNMWTLDSPKWDRIDTSRITDRKPDGYTIREVSAEEWWNG